MVETGVAGTLRTGAGSGVGIVTVFLVWERNVDLLPVGSLGSKRTLLEGISTLRTGAGAIGGAGGVSGLRFRRISAMERRLLLSVSVRGANGDPGDGF